MTFPLQIEEDYINVLNHLEEMDHDYCFSRQSGHLVGEPSFQNLSKSDYAKVIFYNLSDNSDNTVGCRFQITDNVHEDPCDYIGLFRVGYDNLSECLALKMLSETECEEDGKLLRCTFKPSELPHLEKGFYQFLYVTRDHEVCGASVAFRIKNSISKDLSSDEDIVAENSEGDFLVVRSNMAEKNRRLQELVDEMNEKLLIHDNETRQIQEKLKLVNEEKLNIESMLRQTILDNDNLIKETHAAKEEKKKICKEKEEAVRILQEKNKVFSTMFDDYTDKLKEFTEFKNSMLKEKNHLMVLNSKLQEQIKKMAKEIENKEGDVKLAKEKKQELEHHWRKESLKLASELDDARLMIEALEKNKQLSLNELASLNEMINKLQEQLKIVKCENLTLKTQLINSAVQHEKNKERMDDMTNEITALKLHVIEIHESNSNRSSASTTSSGISEGTLSNACAVPQTSKSKKTIFKILEDLPQKVQLQQTGNSGNVKQEFMDSIQKSDVAVLDYMEQASEMAFISKILHEDESSASMHSPLQQEGNFDEMKEKLSDLKMQQRNQVEIDLNLMKAEECLKDNGEFSNLKVQQRFKLMRDLFALTSEYSSAAKIAQADEPSAYALKQMNETLLNKLKLTSKKCEDTQVQNLKKELDEFKTKCDELECLLEQKDTLIFKLREELMKSNGVVEYLTKEKESVQKNGTVLQDALNESILRLSEGSELYKKQFRKIEKLKKKLKKSQTDFMDNSFATSVKDSSSSFVESADEGASTCSVKLSQNQNSDSDTGEHVIRHPANTKMETSPFQAVKVPPAVNLAATVSEPSYTTVREVPGLQTLIEMNLEKFKNSQPKEDEVMFAIPCPVCDQDIGVNMTSTEELVKHLEMQHKQQVCPVCGRLFDMNLPPKYFVFHVEDHFVKDKK